MPPLDLPLSMWIVEHLQSGPWEHIAHTNTYDAGPPEDADKA